MAAQLTASRNGNECGPDSRHSLRGTDSGAAPSGAAFPQDGALTGGLPATPDQAEIPTDPGSITAARLPENLSTHRRVTDNPNASVKQVFPRGRWS